MGLLRFLLIVLSIYVILRFVRWAVLQIAAALRSRPTRTVRSGPSSSPSPKYKDVQEAKFVDVTKESEERDRSNDTGEDSGTGQDG